MRCVICHMSMSAYATVLYNSSIACIISTTVTPANTIHMLHIALRMIWFNIGRSHCGQGSVEGTA